MAKYRLDSIASLARQLLYAPVEARATQLPAAEALLLEIDPAKAYPIEFIVFRITGFRGKTANPQLLTGLALQHDLGFLVESLSESLNLHSAKFAEPVLQIDDLTARFNVTSKTIQRWRRRGLPARRFFFPDGRRRVGFVLSVVERFLATHREQVSAGANFSQVDDAERDQIIRRARHLAESCGCCQGEIARRIARKLNRSPLTIKHTVLKHDQENPGNAIFAAASTALSEDERGRLLKLFRRGVSLKRLAARVNRSRSAVYRVLLDERIARLNRRKARFIDDELYHHPDADLMLNEMLRQQTIEKRNELEARVPRDLPPCLQELYRTPLLSAAQERALFLKFNYLKFRFVEARRELEPQFARARQLKVLEDHLRRAIEVKNEIIRANLRLVVSVARKHMRAGVNLMELVSEGNITLMRAVESFDVHKGFRFSTYATLALMKGFARSVPLLRASNMTASIAKDEMLASVPAARADAFTNDVLLRDQVQHLLGRLTDREREVVQSHYGLNETAPASYDELSERLGLTRQRIRQIEQGAIEKLRGVVVPTH